MGFVGLALVISVLAVLVVVVVVTVAVVNAVVVNEVVVLVLDEEDTTAEEVDPLVLEAFVCEGRV